MLVVLTNLHVTAAVHMGCSTHAAAVPAAVGALEPDMATAGHTRAVSMRHTVLAAAAAAEDAACRGLRGVAHIAAGLGAAGGSTGGLEVGNGEDFGPEGCNPPAAEILEHLPVQPAPTVKTRPTHLFELMQQLGSPSTNRSSVTSLLLRVTALSMIFEPLRRYFCPTHI